MKWRVRHILICINDHGVGCMIYSQMDKASIIKDAIEYIQHLHEQEKIIQAEIMELESGMLKMNPSYDFEQDLPVLLRSKKKRTDHELYDSISSRNSPIEVLEVIKCTLYLSLCSLSCIIDSLIL